MKIKLFEQFNQENIVHIFNINLLIDIDKYIYIIDERKPNVILHKLNLSEYDILKSGLFKNKNNKLVISNSTYYFDDKNMEIITKACVKNKVNTSNLSFINTDLKYKVNKYLLDEFKNNKDDIYVICADNTIDSYQEIINHLDEELLKYGLIVKKYLQAIDETNIRNIINSKSKDYDIINYYDNPDIINKLYVYNKDVIMNIYTGNKVNLFIKKQM